jgi:O-antigen ligase
MYRWPRGTHSPWTWALAVVLLGMGVLWYVLGDPQEAWVRWDRPAKFFLGTACLLFVSRAAPRPRAQFWGLLAGCLGAGAVALWQVYVEGVPRAAGFPWRYTYAIQWGNIALLMGTMLAMQTIVLRRQLGRGWVLAAALAVLMALNASVLSQTRGGWLALAIALPVGLYLLWRFHRRDLWRVLSATAAVLVVVGALNYDVLGERWEGMEKEVQVYSDSRWADTSVGQRLEHWRFAWEAGLERPLLGWGMRGYLDEKARRVAAGQYEPSILGAIHTHNELLDMFIKTGLAGVLWLVLLYTVPLAMFWPTRARMAAYARQSEGVQAQMLALRLGGVCIPVLYAGFGMTQVFFFYNGGIMFYLFMTMLTWAALRGMDAEHADHGPSSRSPR